MNNKRLGIAFENEVVKRLSNAGFWVHFLNPSPNGAQPFDIIAIKGCRIFAIDCKTCKAGSFNISRLEENQKLSFDMITRKTNAEAIVIISHEEHISVIPYEYIKRYGSVNLKDGSVKSKEGRLYIYHELEEVLNDTKVDSGNDSI